MLNHVVPEQLAVVDADEAEDGDARREECTQPGHRLADRPGVARVQGVVAFDRPEVQHQATRIIATGTKSNCVEKSWWPASGCREASSRTAITTANVLLHT